MLNCAVELGGANSIQRTESSVGALWVWGRSRAHDTTKLPVS